MVSVTVYKIHITLYVALLSRIAGDVLPEYANF